MMKAITKGQHFLPYVKIKNREQVAPWYAENSCWSSKVFANLYTNNEVAEEMKGLLNYFTDLDNQEPIPPILNAEV